MNKETKFTSSPDLYEQYATEEACLLHLMRSRYGECRECAKCGKSTRHHRAKVRNAFECEFCGNLVNPTDGTPLEGTRGSLRDWFTVMHVFGATIDRVSAKDIERTVGVTYKTAMRVRRLILHYMGFVQGDNSLFSFRNGVLEFDKAFFGGANQPVMEGKVVVPGAKLNSAENMWVAIQTTKASLIGRN